MTDKDKDKNTKPTPDPKDARRDERRDERPEDRRDDRSADRRDAHREREDERKDSAGRPIAPDYPDGPHPDNTLPGTPGHPDQGLPGTPGHPDQGLPGSPGHPDQGLPGSPGRPSTQPLPGGNPRPDQGLPPTAEPKMRRHVPKNVEEPTPRLAPAELLDQIDQASKVEIGFADHDGVEIEGFARAEIPPGRGSWTEMPEGLALNESAGPLQVHGPGPIGRPVYTLEQYLLFLDDAEVEHAWRPEPLPISAGMTFDLHDDFLM